MSRSAWEIMTGQGGGRVGRWSQPGLANVGPGRGDTLFKPKKAPSKKRRQPTVKSVDQLLEEQRNATRGY